MIITRTPYRISFFGGGTDYPGWYRECGGEVLSTTIDKYCYISCRYLPNFFDHKYRIVYSSIENANSIDQIVHPSVKAVLNWKSLSEGLEIHHDGDLPARSGLGSSSSFTVGLIHALEALQGRICSKRYLAATAIDIEQNKIKENVGSQDQVAAAFGGFNRITFNPDDSFDVNPVLIARKNKELLNSSLLLFYTGMSRIASEIAASKINNISNRRAELSSMKDMVGVAVDMLSSSNFDVNQFGLLLNESWLFKKSLSNQVSNTDIDIIYQKALKAGAIGGKLLGAGGGGFMIFIVDEDKRNNVIKALDNLIHVPFEFETGGSKVVLYEPDGLGQVR